MVFKGPQIVIGEVEGCARCGETHLDMQFTKLNNGGEWQWWGMCPTTRQPVFMSISI